MKVDTNSAKHSATDLAVLCAATIDQINSAETEDRFVELLDIKEWQSVVGKTELIRWAGVLDKMDEILERAATIKDHKMAIDTDMSIFPKVQIIVRFTGLLFENTSSRGIYASTDRLLDLLDCSCMHTVIEVLHLLQVISKRSHFLKNKLAKELQEKLVSKLMAISQSWHGRLRKFRMTDVLDQNLKVSDEALFPVVHKRNNEEIVITKPTEEEPLLFVVERAVGGFGNNSERSKCDQSTQVILTRLRAVLRFSSRQHRILVLMARLIATSTLIYSRLLTEEHQLRCLISSEFIEECADLLKVNIPSEPIVDDLKSEALRTLTSIAAQEKQPRLQQVTEALGASSYHGFLSVLTRKCVEDLTQGRAAVSLCTSLFSLLYHMAGIDAGGEAIVSCGLMPTLLSVVSSHFLPIEHISFVTRCVRVIDIVTTVDAQGFIQSKGFDVCVDRLVYEINECRKEQPYTIDETLDTADDAHVNEFMSSSCRVPCHQQRSALIKSLLNFLKRAVQDSQFADSVRHIMEGELPSALKHIISNSEYYTAGLYHYAIMLVTNFIYQEPTQLTLLQNQHVPFVILQSLLRKEIPASRDVINNIPNTFTALCLNDRGLNQLKAYEPFDHVFRIVMSTKFITALKRRRNDINDLAIALGSTLDDLLRHHPLLRPCMVQSVLRVFDRIDEMSKIKEHKLVMSLSRSTKYASKNAAQVNRAQAQNEAAPSGVQSPRGEDESDDEDDGEPGEAGETSTAAQPHRMHEQTSATGSPNLGLSLDAKLSDGTRVVPLGEYMLIFAKIVETMVTQNASADVLDGLVKAGCVERLLDICQLPVIRIELAQSTLPNTVANIIKFLLQQGPGRNENLLSEVMRRLGDNLGKLVERAGPLPGRAGVLSQMGTAALTDLLATLNYTIAILGTLSKTAQSAQEDMRTRVLKAWTDPDGQNVLNHLNKVFRMICLESVVLHIVQQSTKTHSFAQTDLCLTRREDSPASASSGASTTESDNVAAAEGFDAPPTGQQLALHYTPGQGQHIEQPTDSVSTEAVAPRAPLWEITGVSPEERVFWSGNKETACLLTKLQKSLNDFLVHLSRACPKPPARATRRHYPIADIGFAPMNKFAKQLSENIFTHHKESLGSAKETAGILVNNYLTQVLEQLSVTLFDVRTPNFPLLSVFYRTGCHRQFCDMLIHTIAPQFKLNHTGETVRSLETLIIQWMQLAERLVSKPTQQQRTREQADFPVDKYHKLVQTDLFIAFNNLFSVLSGPGVDLQSNIASCEMTFNVYKDIVRNLVSLRDEVTSETSRRPSDAPNPADMVHPVHLQMLVDMGFARDDVVQALMECGTVAEATDYLISGGGAANDVEMQQPDRTPRQAAGTSPTSSSTDPVAQDQAPVAVAGPSEQVPTESTAEPPQPKKIVETVVPLTELVIDFDIEQTISRTCNEMIPLCMRLMDLGSDLVFSTSDLVIGVIDSCDPTWKKEQLVRKFMCLEIRELADVISKQPLARDKAHFLETRLHFACLLWEHIADEYLQALAETDLRQVLLNLLDILSNATGAVDFHLQDKGLLSPLLLWFDLYDKCSRMSRRRKVLLEIADKCELKWSFYQWEERFGARGRWSDHPADISSTITKAFLNGAPKVSFKMNKKEYTISFSDMTQKSDSGNGVDKNIVSADMSGIDWEKHGAEILDKEQEPIATKEEVEHLLNALVGLLKRTRMHHGVSHSVMLLLTRLTNDPEVAKSFYERDGISALLRLRCSSSPSTTGLLTLIIRNCIEDKSMVAQMMERSIRAVAGGTHNSRGNTPFQNRWNPARNTQMRDWKSSLYVLSPLIAKDAHMFVKTMNSIARLKDGKMTTIAHQHPTNQNNQDTQRANAVVELLLREVIEGDWSGDPNSLTAFSMRMVSRGMLLTLVAELLRGYGCVAGIVSELKYGSNSVVYTLLDSLVASTKDPETHTGLKTFIGTLASCNHATKAQDGLVNDVKSVISAIASDKATDVDVLITKVSELSNLVLMMRDACPSTHAHRPPGQEDHPNPTTPANTNYIVRLVQKRRLCGDLVWAVTQLPLNKKEAIDAVNNVLRTLDELTRNINSQVAAQNAAQNRTAQPTDAAGPSRSTDEAPRAELASDANITVQDVSFSAQPDTHHRVNYHNETVRDERDVDVFDREEDEEDGEGFVDDDDDDDQDDQDDDDGESDMDQSDREQDAAEHDEQDDGMANDDEGDELVEDSMSSGEEDNGGADDTMGEAVEDDVELIGNDRAAAIGNQLVDRDEVPVEVDVGDDSELTEDEEEDGGAFGRFFDEVDQQVGREFGLGRMAAADLLDAQNYLDEIYLDGHGHDVIQLHRQEGRAQATANNAAPQHHPLLVRQQPAEIRRQDGALGRHGLRYNILVDRAGRANGGAAHGLQRQGAVRARVIDNTSLFRDIFDLAHGAPRGLFELRPRPLLSVLERYNGAETSERRFVPVCSALERLADGAGMLEQHSLQMLAIVAQSWVSSVAQQRDEKEKEEAKKETEADKSKKQPAQSATGEPTESVELELDVTQEDLLPGEEPLAEQPVHQEEPMDTSEGATTASQDVPMEQAPTLDTTQADAPDVSPDVSTAMETEQRDTVVREEDTQASESRQVDDVCTAVEQLSSHDSPVAENVTTAVEFREGAPSEEGQAEAAPAADGMEPTQRATSPQQEQPAQAPAAAVDEHPGMIRVPDEYRDALGDTWIPEGVDPAFLAALPEDVRGEVLRDYERQQRAQRASAAPPVTQAQASGAAAPATTEGDAAAAPAAAPAALPGVEPLDQEFLAALPPELQEEILAQHERAVREAQAAAQAAANPAPQVPAPAGDDAVAVLESLPPSLRQQVLADADDSVLAALPPNVAEEARRLRSQFDREQALRVQHRLMIPTRRGFYARVGQGQAQGQAIGGHAGNAATAPNNAVQILDKDSIVTLVLLFLVDNPRLSFGRLQRVIRSLCSHAATCDFVIWCFLALLDKTTESSDDDDVVGGGSSWIDSLTVTASGNNEQALRVGKDGGNVTVHPLIGQTASRTLLDSLLTIAKAYPGHLLPEQLRNRATAASATEAPSLDTFWDLVRKHGQGKQAKDFNLSEIKFSSLDDCPLASLMSYLEKGVVRKNTPLQERLLKVGTCVVQTLPEDTVSKLGLSPATTPLSAQLRSLISLLTQATCSNDAITEGRAMVVEAMRALPASTSLIYSLLFESIEKLGLNLFPQIQELVQQLDALAPSAATTSTATSAPPAEPTLPRNRSQVNRWNGERVVLEGDSTGRVVAASVCEELRLPAVRALTDKSGVQHALLSSLQTITKIRDSTRQMKEQKRKKEEKEKADKEKKEEEERKKEAAKNKESGVDGEKKDEAEAAATASSTVGETSVEMQPSTSSATATDEVVEDALSTRLDSLNELWDLVSLCLTRLGKASDPHAVLALQPAAEAFFLVHAVPTSTIGPVDHEKAQNAETSKLIHFAEQHRCVLNQVLRQNPVALSEGGPFAVLTQFPKLLDFDVKRKYFRKQLTQIEENRPFRREDVPIRVRRAHIFSESYRELFRLRPHEWKHRFYIMFDGEEGQDAGGLLREWYAVITREIFNPNYALFITSPGDRVTYMINKASYINPEHLDYFKFVGRIIAKAIYDNKLLDCYFTRAFYKHILNLPVRYQDLESEDPSFYNSLQFILENPINELGLDLTFTLEVEEFGVREQRELKPDGHNIAVTDENKEEYVKLVCQMKMTGSIRKQLDAFLCGFYEIIPKNLISMFNEQELELLISGLPDLDIDDLATNTEYRSYTKQSPQIQWFWRALRSFEQEDRAKFLQFVTGTSKVPLQGFASLEGMNGIQKFSIHMDSRSGDRLPTAHTCFNQLDLPQYESYEKLRDTLLTAIRECTEGFGFA